MDKCFGLSVNKCQDVTECILLILAQLHGEIKLDFSFVAYNETFVDGGLQILDKANQFWDTYNLDNGYSPITDHFFYQLLVTSTCDCCKNSYYTFDIGNIMFVEKPKDDSEITVMQMLKYTMGNNYINTKISSLIDTPLEMYRKNKSQTLIQFKKIIRLGYVLMVLSGYSSTTYQCLRTKINNALDSAPDKQLSSKVCDSDISFEFNLLDSKYISTYKTFYNFIISQRNQEKSNDPKVFLSKPIVMDEEDDEYINPTETNPEASIVNPVSNEQESVLPESTNMNVDVNKDTSMSIDQLTSTTNNYSNTIDFSQDTSINNLTVPEGYKLLKKAKAVLQKHMDESNNKRLLNKIDTAFSNMTQPLDPVREFLPPQGLPNTGLNCYLNSVLQCLVRLDALFVCLQDNKSNAACSNLLKSFMTAYKTNIGLSDVLGKISYVSELKTYTIFIDLIELSLVHG